MRQLVNGLSPTPLEIQLPSNVSPIGTRSRGSPSLKDRKCEKRKLEIKMPSVRHEEPANTSK